MSVYDPHVISRILELRSSLADELQRTPGPKPILYHLAQDTRLDGLVLPRSTRDVVRRKNWNTQ